MVNIKYGKSGRPSQALKDFYIDVKLELKEKGISGDWTYTSREDLEAIRSEALSSLEPKQVEKTTTNNTTQTDNTMSKKGVEITDFPKKEQIEPQPQVETNNEVDFSDFDFSGVTQDIKQREYNEMPVTEYMGVDIPEPVVGNTFQAMINKQNNDEASSEAEHGGGGNEGGGNESKSEPIGNPAMNDLDDKEKTFAAEQLVDAVLSGYDGLHQIARHYVGFNDKKVSKLISDGEIDAEVTFPIDLSGQEVNITEYAQVFNEEVNEIFTPDPEFNKKVRPAMVREAKKMNLGITDRQFILGMFAKDIATKGAQAVGLKRSANGVIESLKELNQRRQEQAPRQEAVSPDIITKPNRHVSVEDVEIEQD